MCILGRDVASFHGFCESLPGIVTSYGVNLLKSKVCNNLRLVAANFTKNIQERDWTMFKNLWRLQRCGSKNASVTGVRFSSFYTIFLKYRSQTVIPYFTPSILCNPVCNDLLLCVITVD